MSVGLYLDDDTGITDLVEQAEIRGLRVWRSDDVGMRGKPDIEHLRFAASNDLALVTCNRRDFLRLHAQFLQSNEPHAGIMIVSQQIPKGVRIRGLLLFAEIASASDVQNRLEHLKEWL